ncbi:tyrosine-protein phosphatase [Nocardia rhizosphaerihabitans]|uniref:Phosphotyrosine protein phosphatase n=1 Tax=Nocardia rhizosphaerihabitans TaxID=1691570 RepID=A0ABQ2K909_9NOCA|nr:tyrosine-protein phosphatase [Nocardia rhizosphaerihabitans]GGN76057.1 phosphotyrosine protein phosphatase [Nocardia rhizosphaerihabitans]
MTLSPPADQFAISGTFNFRDVGGLRTADGTTTRPGVLLRSAQLSGLDAKGHDTLRTLRVTDVHDLRGLAEIDHIGHDTLPDGVRLHVTPFDSRMGEAPPHEAQKTSARAHMIEVYRLFPVMPEAHAAIIRLATSVAEGDGAALVHCAAGKDRTGWAVATVLRAVGVTEDDVYTDYLASNAAVEPLRMMLEPKIATDGALSIDLLGVHEEYLRTADVSVHETYGGTEGYLSAIGLTGPLREALRTRLI